MPDEMDIDEAWERELAELGPVMLRQEHADAEEPDPVFVQSLRARLTGEPGASTAATELVDRAGRAGRARRPAGPRRRWLWGGGLAAAAVAAAAIAFVSTRPSTTPTQHAAFALPTPNATQLAQGYPVLGGLGSGGGTPSPWDHLMGIPSGGAYPGHLRLSASSFPSEPTSARAYRLAGSSFAAPRIASLAKDLAISGPVKRGRAPDGSSWTYVWDLSKSAAHPLNHSVAVSLQTGELVYHDLSASAVSRHLALNSPRNVAIAQAWLTRLGWPGAAMPVHVPTSAVERDLTDTVTLGWPGAGPVDAPAAMLYVDAAGTVEEAQVWPPVAQSGVVLTRPAAAAWRDLQSGRAPVAVIQREIGEPFNNGTGTLQTVSILEVFTETPTGKLYLAPAYRFQGSAIIKKLGRRRWFGLAPAGG